MGRRGGVGGDSRSLSHYSPYPKPSVCSKLTIGTSSLKRDFNSLSVNVGHKGFS